MHISDIRKFVRCPKMYYLSLSDNQRSFPFYNIITNTDESIRLKLNINEYFEGQPNQSSEDTLAQLANYTWFFKARFVYHGLRVKVPVIENLGDNNINMYFVSLSLNPGEDEAVNIKWHKIVVEKNGLHVNKIFLIHLNKNYVRKQELDHQQLWKISTNFYNGSGNPTKPIMEYVEKVNLDVDMILESILHFDYDENVLRTNKCTGKKKCAYYDYCFPEEKYMPDNSILTLVSSAKKYDMFHHGIRNLANADLGKIEGTGQQYAQIMADRNGGLFFDKCALKGWLDNEIKYPISFVDFEWDLFAIPPYEKMKPLQVLPFQYSLHVDDGKELKHYQFIGLNDSRKEFIEHLINETPKTGSIVAYNATGAEIIRLKELMQAYPEYSEPLQDMIDRMVDLAVPFSSGLVYDTRMRGLYSLKVLEGIIDKEHSYKDLDCGDGLKAVEIYRILLKCNDEETKNKYLEQLYEYCGLDSYSMIKVYNWLKDLVK